jgi:hypothetical protein
VLKLKSFGTAHAAWAGEQLADWRHGVTYPGQKNDGRGRIASLPISGAEIAGLK